MPRVCRVDGGAADVAAHDAEELDHQPSGHDLVSALSLIKRTGLPLSFALSKDV